MYKIRMYTWGPLREYGKDQLETGWEWRGSVGDTTKDSDIQLKRTKT